MTALSTALLCAMLVPRAEEAWEPVLFGGLIPIIGALAVFYIIWRAVRDTPEGSGKDAGLVADAAPDEMNSRCTERS